MTVTRKVLGFNDEQTHCDACGKVELRGTVIIADEDGVEVARQGTTCASRTVGWKVTRSDAKNLEASRRQHFASEYRRAKGALVANDTLVVADALREMHRLGAHRTDEIEAVARFRAALLAHTNH